MPRCTAPVAALALLLAGCATAPEPIRTPLQGPEVQQVRADPGAWVGSRVRWGGTIAGVENFEDRTIITIVARPLSRRGEPYGDRRAAGRFMAEFRRFLDPEEYRQGRRITVVGRFIRIRQAPIDEYVYDYPVVESESLYMWTDYEPRRRYYDWPYYRRHPYWYDPFWPHYHGLHRRHPRYW